jgi:hypothetical protein
MMPKYDLEWAFGRLSQLNPDQKINTMLMTAAYWSAAPEQ